MTCRWTRNSGAAALPLSDGKVISRAGGKKLYKSNVVAEDYSELYHSNGVAAGQVTGTAHPAKVDNAQTGYDPLGRMTGFFVGKLTASQTGGRRDTIEAGRRKYFTTWTYDEEGNWSDVNINGTPRNLNEYDALGRMISYAVEETYYSAAWHPIVVARDDGPSTWAPSAENVWSLAYVDAMLFQDRAYAGAMQRVYPLHDASYDVTSLVTLVDGVWQVTQRHLYEPYGKVWATLDGLCGVDTSIRLGESAQIAGRCAE